MGQSASSVLGQGEALADIDCPTEFIDPFRNARFSKKDLLDLNYQITKQKVRLQQTVQHELQPILPRLRQGLMYEDKPEIGDAFGKALEKATDQAKLLYCTLQKQSRVAANTALSRYVPLARSFHQDLKTLVEYNGGDSTAFSEKLKSLDTLVQMKDRFPDAPPSNTQLEAFLQHDKPLKAADKEEFLRGIRENLRAIAQKTTADGATCYDDKLLLKAKRAALRIKELLQVLESAPASADGFTLEVLTPGEKRFLPTEAEPQDNNNPPTTNNAISTTTGLLTTGQEADLQSLDTFANKTWKDFMEKHKLLFARDPHLPPGPQETEQVQTGAVAGSKRAALQKYASGSSSNRKDFERRYLHNNLGYGTGFSALPKLVGDDATEALKIVQKFGDLAEKKVHELPEKHQLSDFFKTHCIGNENITNDQLAADQTCQQGDMAKTVLSARSYLRLLSKVRDAFDVLCRNGILTEVKQICAVQVNGMNSPSVPNPETTQAPLGLVEGELAIKFPVDEENGFARTDEQLDQLGAKAQKEFKMLNARFGELLREKQQSGYKPEIRKEFETGVENFIVSELRPYGDAVEKKMKQLHLIGATATAEDTANRKHCLSLPSSSGAAEGAGAPEDAALVAIGKDGKCAALKYVKTLKTAKSYLILLQQLEHNVVDTACRFNLFPKGKDLAPEHKGVKMTLHSRPDSNYLPNKKYCSQEVQVLEADGKTDPQNVSVGMAAAEEFERELQLKGRTELNPGAEQELGDNIGVRVGENDASVVAEA
ncbi:unnamed protein product [Amoebophrya sp. A120]|nr:unnamed protein product [Amoebophrya sp. A120]|eukprot:GSA120T00009125001.1